MSTARLDGDVLGLFDEPATWFGGPPSARETSRGTAKAWIGRWHYLGVMPGAGTVPYGFFLGDLAAVVTVSSGSLHGLAAAYNLQAWPGNYEITRVVCHPEAPKNTASQAIAAVCRLVRGRGRAWVYSYADTGQGHHGGIYQALNCVYVGFNGGHYEKERWGYLADGKIIHTRQISDLWGTRAWPAVQALAAKDGVRLERVAGMSAPKHTYVYPVGSPAVNRAIRKALAPYSLPYPKREHRA